MAQRKDPNDPGVALTKLFYDKFSTEFGYPYGGVWYKSTAIMSGFYKRYGAKAQEIVEFAFDRLHGRLNGEPMTIETFCAGSDWKVQKIRNIMHNYAVMDRDEKRLQDSGGWLTGDEFNNRESRSGQQTVGRVLH